MIDPKSGMEIVTEPFWPIEDRWPPGTLTEGKVQAYKHLDRLGAIRLRKVYYNKQTGVTRVVYDALETDEKRRAEALRDAYKAALLSDGVQVRMEVGRG